MKSQSQDLADFLDGSEYPLRLSTIQRQFALDHGLVIVYGASDDLVEFDGRWVDEAGAPGSIWVNEKGLIETPDCDCIYSSLYYEDKKKKSAKIEIHQGTDIFWSYETQIPHATFNIMEDGDINCRAMVFAIDDLASILP